jgi:hypothetical protein
VINRGQHGAHGHLALPVLAEAYVNPAYRVTVAEGETTRAFEEDWWRNAAGEVRDDIEGFLARHLHSPDATVLPLLVLGEPGAGKSVFTRTFAGRLLATGFRPLRVDLRRVPADASVVDQVRIALREALQRDADWADLAEDTAGGPPAQPWPAPMVRRLDGQPASGPSAPAGRGHGAGRPARAHPDGPDRREAARRDADRHAPAARPDRGDRD